MADDQSLRAIRGPGKGKWHIPDDPGDPLNSDPNCRSAWALKYEAERLSVLPPSALCRRCFPLSSTPGGSRDV